MKEKTKLPAILLIVSAAAAVVSAAVRILLTLTEFDIEYGIYNQDAVLPSIYHITLFVICAALIVLSFLCAPKRPKEFLPPVKDISVFISSLTAFMLAASTLLTIYYILRGAHPDIFDILEIIFTIPAVVFFFGLIKKSGTRANSMVFASFGPIAWCSVCLIRIYFDNSLLHTSPTKTFSELAILAAMVYFLTESRFQLGITSHKFYLAAALCAPVILITDALPGLILAKQLLIGSSLNLMHCIVELAFAVFIYARLASYISAKDDKAPAEV